MKPHLWLIHLLGVIVPRRLRTDWRQEWEAELRSREDSLAGWERLDWRGKLDLLRRSTSAFWDALLLQPRRLEDELFQDLRFGARMLVKNPGFTLVVVLSLALGIGANTVVFSLLDAVLLKSLPVPEPERLVHLQWLSGDKTLYHARTSEGKSERDAATGLQIGGQFSYPAFHQLRSNNKTLSDVFGFFNLGRVNVLIDGNPEYATGQLVSGNYFPGLWLPAFLGRVLNEADDRREAEPVLMISHGYWRRRFGGDPRVIGKVVYLKERAFTIVGVTPPEFYGTSNIGTIPDFSAPLEFLPQIQPQNYLSLSDPLNWWLNLMGRLKPGVSLQQAQTELDLRLQQHTRELQASSKERLLDLPRLTLASGSQGLMQRRREYSEPLRLLMIIVGLVLAVACLNVANLLTARAASRRSEIAVRMAVGAGRLRLIRQLLTESLLLAALGGAVGITFAWWGRGALLALNPLGATAKLPDLALDLRVLSFTAAIAVLTGILFGSAPAFRATRVDLNSALKSGAAFMGQGRSRLIKGLVVAQVAISLLLLVGAGLFVRTLRNLTRIDIGYNKENLLLFNVVPVIKGYKGEALARLYPQLTESVRATPGVRSVTASTGALFGGVPAGSFCVPGYTPQPQEKMSLSRIAIAPNFFETLGIPILHGRGLTSEDNEAAIPGLAAMDAAGGRLPSGFVRPREVAVINQSMARKYFAGSNPVGRVFTFNTECDGSWVEIVGVVADARYGDVKQEALPVAYIPYIRVPFGAPSQMTFLIRTDIDATSMTTVLQKAIQSVDPGLPIYGIKTQKEQIAEAFAQSRMFAGLSSFFGILTLTLVAVGLYGVMSYTVARRTHEIGVRMALGAQAGDVLRLVMRETLWLALAGVLIGVPAAMIAMRWIAGQLFGLSPHDPLTMISVALLMTTVMALAGYLPARRAAQVDPLKALRQE